MMKNILKPFTSDERGSSIAKYGLITALLAIGIISSA